MRNDNVYDKECFNPDERKVLNTMYDWGRGMWTPHYWNTYDVLEEDTGIKIKDLKVIMKSLKERGVVFRASCSSEDGELTGSGFFITNIEGFDEMIKVED